jgi:hypothetical protein
LREFVEGRKGYKDHAALKSALDAWFDEVIEGAMDQGCGSEA